MIKVLPLENKAKCEPYYQIRTAIMTEKGHNMDYNVSTLGEKKYNIPFDIAEEMVKKWNKWKQHCKNVDLEIELDNLLYLEDYLICGDNQQFSRLGASCYKSLKDQGLTEEDISEISSMYKEHRCHLFNDIFEYNFNYLIDISIVYIDENGDQHDCEVI